MANDIIALNWKVLVAKYMQMFVYSLILFSYKIQVDEPCSPDHRFENLPDVILFKIFSYLYIGDLCRAGR